MTNAALRGKPDAGNPHVRFDEGEVASAKPRRGSLLYNRLLIGAALAASLALTASARVDKYMFGHANAPAEQRDFAGFTYCSPTSSVFSADAKNLYGWAYNARGGATFSRGDNGTLPADTLLEHGICTIRDVKLRLPFAGEKAKVHVWIGDWFKGWRRFYNGRDKDPVIALTCDGKVVYGTDWSPTSAFKNWCKLEEYSFSKKDGIWDRIVKPICDEVTFEATVKDGVVELDLRHILLTAVVVTSTDEEMAQALADVEKARREMFVARYPWKPQPDEPMPANVDLTANCVIFQRSGMDNVKPWSRPKAGEVTDTVRIFAAKGEQEPFRFGVIPLKDYKTLEVEVGDFVGPNGVTLKTAEVADFWRERYKERGSEGTRGKIDQLWRLDPLSYVLQKNGPQCGEAGTPRMFDLDMFVPANAVAGDYTATLTVKGDGAVIRTGELLLKVLPFELRYKGAAQYGFQSGYGNGALYAPGETRESTTAGVEDIMNMMNKYRFHNIVLTAWGYGFPSYHSFGKIVGKPGERHFTITPEQEKEWDWWFGIATKNGDMRYTLLETVYLMLNMGWRSEVLGNQGRFRDPKWFTPEMQEKCRVEREDLVTVLGEIDRFMRKKGYPEPRWYVAGELDNYGLKGVEECCKLADVCRRAGVISHCVINGPLAYKMTPPVFDHVWANPASPVDENLKATIEKYGHGFGAHNSGDTRFQCGFQFWRIGAEGRYQETQFYTDFMRPFCLLPWNYNTAQAYPGPDGKYRPTLPWLNYRDGRDDYLYLYTLEQTLKDGKGSAAARAKAEKFLAYMTKKVHFDPRDYHAAHFDGIEATVETMTDVWNGVSIERYRWRIAQLIAALEEGK